MASSKNNSSCTSPRQSDDNNQEIENGKWKTAISNQAQILPIVDDGEEPCCSRSLPHRVRFSCNDANDVGDKWETVKTEFIAESYIPPKGSLGEQPPPLTPLSSAIHHHPRDHDEHKHSSDIKNDSASDNNKEFQSEVVGSPTQPFSDSVLALPNLLQFEESKEEPEEINVEPESRDEGQRDDISRKFPKIDFARHLDTNNNDEEECDKYDQLEKSYKQHVRDENNNVILWPIESEKKLIEHASYIFHKDRRAELERLMKLMPRGRQYVVFNIFTDLARLIGLGRKRKRVAFPEEFLEKYQQQGDVAGKDRFVPSTKQPYKGIQTSSMKRRLSAVYSSWTVKSAEFVPRVDRVDNTNKCEYCCEKYFLTCDCCKSSKKLSDVSTVMEGYLGDLNLASLFLHGHATRTFESAMSNLEFVKFNKSTTGMAAPSPWAVNYADQHIGVLSGSIWIWTYCIRSIIVQSRDKNAEQNVASLPSEESFRKVMEQYATLCLTLSENVKTVLQYNHNFYNFCKECIRIIKVIQVNVGFRGEIRLRKPIKRGDGLELNRLEKREIGNLKSVDVMVARHTQSKGSETEETSEVLEWTNFDELLGKEKAVSLYQLLNVTTEGMNMVQTQLRFLLDDIVDSVKDTTEADLLFLLADIFDRVKFLQNVGLKRVKPEIEQISRTMSDFCKDFQSFVDYGQHIMKRFVELRDMVHVSYEFLIHGLKLESVSEMVPSTTFKKKRKLTGCCSGGSGVDPKGLKRSIIDHHPKYQVLDFFRVYYRDAVKWKTEIYANKYSFQLELGKHPIKDALPKGAEQIWGPENISPRFSFEEYIDNDIAEDDSGAGDIPGPKPILVVHENVYDNVVGAEENTDLGGSGQATDNAGTTLPPPQEDVRGSAGSADSNNDDNKRENSK